MNTTNLLNGKRNAILRSILFWVGFFALLFLTRTIVGKIGKSQSADQWFGGALMTVFLLVWTRICVKLERGIVNPGTAFSRGSILRTLLGLAFAVPLCAISLVAIKWLVPGVEFRFVGIGIRPIIVSVFLFLLLAAYEEIGFRGYPLSRLLPSFGIWPTLLMIAPIFALYHIAIGWTPTLAFIGTGVGSLLFGMAAIAAKRGLAFPVGVHAGWNFTTWGLSSGSGPWRMTFPSNMSERVQTTGMIMYVVCMLFGTFLLWVWMKRTAEP